MRDTPKLARVWGRVPRSVTSPTLPPLAARVVSVTVPPALSAADLAALGRRCGAWDAGLSRADPPATFRQALCHARAVAGVPERSSSGLDRSMWRRAAALLAMDPALGPSGDPDVWVAQLGGAAHEAGEGKVVVLDAAFGAPYAVVSLRRLA